MGRRSTDSKDVVGDPELIGHFLPVGNITVGFVKNVGHWIAPATSEPRNLWTGLKTTGRAIVATPVIFVGTFWTVAADSAVSLVSVFTYPFRADSRTPNPSPPVEVTGLATGQLVGGGQLFGSLGVDERSWDCSETDGQEEFDADTCDAEGNMSHNGIEAELQSEETDLPPIVDDTESTGDEPRTESSDWPDSEELESSTDDAYPDYDSVAEPDSPQLDADSENDGEGYPPYESACEHVSDEWQENEEVEVEDQGQAIE